MDTDRGTGPAGTEKIRFDGIRHGDLLRVIEHRTARRVTLRAERFVWDGIDTFTVSDGEQEVRAIIEHIERVTAQAEPVRDICWCGWEKQPGEDHSMCYPAMD